MVNRRRKRKAAPFKGSACDIRQFKTLIADSLVLVREMGREEQTQAWHHWNMVTETLRSIVFPDPNIGRNSTESSPGGATTSGLCHTGDQTAMLSTGTENKSELAMSMSDVKTESNGKLSDQQIPAEKTEVQGGQQLESAEVGVRSAMTSTARRSPRKRQVTAKVRALQKLRLGSGKAIHLDEPASDKEMEAKGEGENTPGTFFSLDLPATSEDATEVTVTTAAATTTITTTTTGTRQPVHDREVIFEIIRFSMDSDDVDRSPLELSHSVMSDSHVVGGRRPTEDPSRRGQRIGAQGGEGFLHGAVSEAEPEVVTAAAFVGNLTERREGQRRETFVDMKNCMMTRASSRVCGGANISDLRSRRPFATQNSREHLHPMAGHEKRKGSLAAAIAPKKQRVGFKVDLPQDPPTTFQEVSFNLSTLSRSIDDMLECPPEGVVTIDVREDEGSFNSPAYAPTIMRYLKTREDIFALPAEPLHRSTAVRPSSRAVVVDWLIQVQTHLDLEDECLHLTLALLDQMLAVLPVALGKVQLIGVACLFISTKLIERFAPSLRKLLRLTENAYDECELKAAEQLVLQKLNFDVYLPTPVMFVNRCLRASEHEMDRKRLVELNRMVSYILIHSAVDLKVMVLRPSLRAAAATWLARQLLLSPSIPVWTRSLSYYSTFNEEELLPVVGRMAATLLKRTTTKYQAASAKFRSQRDYGAVSTHPCFTQVDLLHRLAVYTPELGSALTRRPYKLIPRRRVSRN